MHTLILRFDNADDARRVTVAISQLRAGNPTHTGLLDSRLSRVSSAELFITNPEADTTGMETGQEPETGTLASLAHSPTHTQNAEQIRCARCGKGVSSPVPAGTIVRAWVECPECLQRNTK